MRVSPSHRHQTQHHQISWILPITATWPHHERRGRKIQSEGRRNIHSCINRLQTIHLFTFYIHHTLDRSARRTTGRRSYPQAHGYYCGPTGWEAFFFFLIRGPGRLASWQAGKQALVAPANHFFEACTWYMCGPRSPITRIECCAGGGRNYWVSGPMNVSRGGL